MSHIPPVIPLDGTTISSSPENSSIDEINQRSIISSTIPYSVGTQHHQNGLSSISSNNSSNLSGTIDSLINKSSTVGNVPNNEISSMTMLMISSPSYNDNLSSEQRTSLLNESSDEVNLSSLLYLQSKQRQINHRRNKSEPVIIGNLDKLSTKTILESSSTSTTSNESALSGNASSGKKRKSSTKKTSPNINNNKQELLTSQLQDRLSSSSSTTTTTKKKKPWYNPFQSTYRQRNEEFRKLFKDLPNDERLIVDYSCAWQKEILIQGRMYISQNYLCFHANFLKWETSLCLKFHDIIGITREKTAKVIPNAIEVRANKNEKYFFASFATRDKSYAMIFRIWQMVLTQQPISSQQIWIMIRESYGNDLDIITDEEDSFNKQSINSTPEKTSPKQEKYQQITPNSQSSTNSKKEELDDHSSMSSRSDRRTDDDLDGDDDLGIIPIGEEANTNTLIRQPLTNFHKQENILSTMINLPEEQTYLTTCPCPCQSHLATKLIDRTYPTSVERLFDYIFDDRDFLAAYHASRRIKDFQASEWTINTETRKRERVCTYKVSVTAVFGATTICSNEKQSIDCETSKSHYIIDTEVRNEGIKYADTFFVASRYCLVQTGPNKSHLKVTCEVRYVKSVMMIIKSFVEKNAMAALQDSFTDLNNRIERSTSSVKRIEHESLNRQRTSSITNHHDKEKTTSFINSSKKKHSRKQQSNDLDSSIEDSSSNKHRKHIHQDDHTHYSDSNSVISSPSTYISSSTWSTNNFLIPFCIITMLILLTVNIFLCVKLNEIDRMTDRLIQNYPLWSNDFSYPKQENEWSILLKRQEEYYQTKLNGLQSVILSTHNALKNVTDALNELSKLSSGSNVNAPINRLQSL
ncbi:hypothetical protein I4U23_031241 [Adineta vaga]|nr:hypothetical protein I4U23_031241 [Adineta vaga]